MRELRRPSRRVFGQSLGASLALIVLARGGPAPGGARAEVEIRRFAFGPGTLTIPRGTVVRWTNLDTAPHTATAVDGSWDSGALERGEAAEIHFAEAGEHPYYCVYHPHMTGIVRVAG